MKDFLVHLRACLLEMCYDEFNVSDCTWKDYRSNSVAIWVNYISRKGILACDVSVMNRQNRDYISVTFFWRKKNDIIDDSNAANGSLTYWENYTRLGYSPVEHKDGKYRLGKDYNIKKITYIEMARELFNVFSFIEDENK